MSGVFEGHLVATGLRFAIVHARWNDFMGARLLEAARDTLIRHGAAGEDIDIARVPGSFELPLIALKLAQSGRYDGVICLGVLIRGGTIHFDLIAAEAAKGIAAAAMQSGIPVTFGVVTAESIEQAVERCGCKAGNKGVEAAVAAIEMANLIKSLP